MHKTNKFLFERKCNISRRKLWNSKTVISSLIKFIEILKTQLKGQKQTRLIKYKSEFLKSTVLNPYIPRHMPLSLGRKRRNRKFRHDWTISAQNWRGIERIDRFHRQKCMQRCSPVTENSRWEALRRFRRQATLAELWKSMPMFSWCDSWAKKREGGSPLGQEKER